MAEDRIREPDDEFEIEVVEDVEWLVDDDGTEYFLEDGVRYELGEDGYAYPADEPRDAAPHDATAPPATAPPAATPPTTAPPAAAAPAARGPAPGPAPTSDNDLVRPVSASGPLSGPRVSDDPPAWRSASADGGGPSPFSREGESLRVEGDADPERQIRTVDASPNGDLLRLSDVRSGYGSLPVLHGVDMAIRPGETAVLLGLNGAGKTTTAMNICGALTTWDGTIAFDGQDITTWSTSKAVDAGVVMVPEGRRVFPDLTVEKNLQMGAWSQRKHREWIAEQRDRVFDYFPRLRERASQLAGTLSGGEQQMLAIARGLMARPKLLIIDEASMGLAPVIVADVFEIVGHINADGTTVLMIEQNVAALEVADVAYVMEQGRMVKELRGELVHDLDQVSEVLMG